MSFIVSFTVSNNDNIMTYLYREGMMMILKLYHVQVIGMLRIDVSSFGATSGRDDTHDSK